MFLVIGILNLRKGMYKSLIVGMVRERVLIIIDGLWCINVVVCDR